MVAQFIPYREHCVSKPETSRLLSPKLLSKLLAYQEVQSKQMTPEEFKAYWDCDYQQLAKICRCSYTTVALWFAEGSKYHKQPKAIYKERLWEAHQILLSLWLDR